MLKMYRIIFSALFVFPFAICFGQDSTNNTQDKVEIEPETVKIGHLFYLKTEALNSLKFFLEPKSYDLDLQLTYRLSNSLHLVGTYGKTTYYTFGTSESTVTSGKFQQAELIGTSKNRSSLMARWYPFSGGNDLLDYAFVEAGMFFQEYTGSTVLTIYENEETNVTNQNLRELNFYRLGPQINIGLSRRHTRDVRIRKMSFSPEFFLGFYYNHVKIVQDEVSFLIGAPEPYENYSEPRFRVALRAKIGFGFF
ncbi:MAG: hypothetical protein ACI837_002857 [Crocinitomicaceae bacterium]|jgi:hypothetical protein